MSKRLESLIGYINNTIERERAVLSKFREELDKNPVYALEWSNNVFTAAARVEVYGRILKALREQLVEAEGNEAEVLGRMQRACEQQALRYLRSGSSSTSVVKNLVRECEATAYADVSEWIGGAL